MRHGCDPVQVELITSRSNRVLAGHSEANCALECPLLDITGQIMGLSIAELVGSRKREANPLGFSVANRDFEPDLECVRELWSDDVT